MDGESEWNFATGCILLLQKILMHRPIFQPDESNSVVCPQNNSPKQNTCIHNQIISFSIMRFINKLAYNPAGEQYTHPGHSPAWQQQTRGFALQHPPCSGLVKGEADASFTKDSLPPSISVLKHTCTYAQTFSKRAATPLFLASLPAQSNNNRDPLLIQTGIQFHSLHFFFL